MSLISTVFVLKLKSLIVLGTVKKKYQTIKRINSFIYLFLSLMVSFFPSLNTWIKKNRIIFIKLNIWMKWNKTDLEKLARFCTTLAMRVSVRDVCSSGYSWVRLKSDGDMIAGHRKRRKREPLMRRSAMSSRPLSAQRTRQEAKTSFSSRGNTL